MTSRRSSLLFGSTLLAVAALALGCSSSAPPDDSGDESKDPQAPVELTFVAYGGAGQDAMIAAWQDPYVAKNPHVSFLNTAPAEVAQVKAQVLAGNPEWDLVSVAPYAATQNCGTLFEKIEVPQLDPADFPDGTIGECSVNVFVNSPLLAYNSERFPDPDKAPKSVKDFFDAEKFPGKRGIVATLQDGMLEYPMLAKGVKPADIYPVDIDEALAVWDPIRADTLFAPNVGALQQAVAGGQVDMWFLVTSRQLALLDDGVPVQPVWDVTLAAANSFAIPLGSPNKDAAVDFLQFMVQPEQSAREAELGGVTPVNLNSKPSFSDNGKIVDIYSDDNTGDILYQDSTWYAEHYNDLQPVLIKWLNG